MKPSGSWLFFVWKFLISALISSLVINLSDFPLLHDLGSVLSRKWVVLGKERPGTFQEVGCSYKWEGEEAAMAAEFGEEEEKISVFQTCLGQVPCMEPHNHSDQVPIEGQ